jgi:hypothetical protein
VCQSRAGGWLPLLPLREGEFCYLLPGNHSFTAIIRGVVGFTSSKIKIKMPMLEITINNMWIPVQSIFSTLIRLLYLILYDLVHDIQHKKFLEIPFLTSWIKKENCAV